MTGTVRSASDCRPVPGALVVYWIESPAGAYDDDHRGSVTTDPNGRYRLETNAITGSPGPDHVHIEVMTAGYQTVETVHEPPLNSSSATIDFVLPPTQ